MVTTDDLRAIFGAECASRSSGAHSRSRSHTGKASGGPSGALSRSRGSGNKEKGCTTSASHGIPHALYKLQVFEHEISLTFDPARYENEPEPNPVDAKLFPEKDTRKEEEDAPPSREEGDITTFSKKSRFRLFRLFNRVQVSRLSDALFLSLTASPKALNSDAFQHAFKKSFIPRLKKIFPNGCWIWRLEPHRSGRPHYHMILWSYNLEKNMQSEYWKRQVRKAWRLTIGDDSRASELYSCKIRDVNSFEKARSYMSEYLAKEDDSRSLTVTGRRWGRTKNLPVAPIAEIWIRHSELEQLETLAKAILRGQSRDASRSIERIELYDSWFLWLDLGVISWIMERLQYHKVVDHLDLHVLPKNVGSVATLPAKKEAEKPSESLASKVEYALSIKEEFEELAGRSL